MATPDCRYLTDPVLEQIRFPRPKRTLTKEKTTDGPPRLKSPARTETNLEASEKKKKEQTQSSSTDSRGRWPRKGAAHGAGNCFREGNLIGRRGRKATRGGTQRGKRNKDSTAEYDGEGTEFYGKQEG